MTDPMNDIPEPSQRQNEADEVNSPVIQPTVDSEVLAEDARQAERRKHRRRMSQEHIRRIKRKKRIRTILIVVGVVVLLFAALTAWLGLSALKAKDEITAAVAAAGQIQTQVKAGDTEKAQASIEEFSQRIDNTYAQTKQPVWKLATFVPYYGSDVKAVRDMVKVLEDVSINALPKLSTSVKALNLNEIGIKDGVIQLGDMASVADELSAANSVISDASVEMNNISGTHVQLVTDALDQGKAKFKELASLTDTASRIADVLPSMVNVDGSDKPRTYILVAQNNAELRATGGIPASWGTLTVDQGKFTVGEFGEPPREGLFSQDEAMTVLTADERNLFSTKMATDYPDLTFSPDFSRDADLIQQVWQRAGRGTVDGVISVDPVFLQRLLKVTGSVTLSDGTEMNGDNTGQIILNQTYIDKDTQEEQNAFFSMAASEIFDHVSSSLDGKNQQLMQTFEQSVTDNHVYVWSAHDSEQERIKGTTISGMLQTSPAHPVTGVYFNDATMGKMDWYLKREVTSTYDKTYPSGAKQYTIHIKLTNTADAAQVNAAPDLLRGYDHDGTPRKGEIETVLYVYAPSGGRLVDWTQSFDQLATHDGLTVGSKTVTLQPGEVFEVTVHVAASFSAEENEMILRQTPLVD
ncbi:DUF4012 domain-containing protein [Bifidobacterium longum]|nr:DUF4012 domain-containing protein [Bifidobacterium longum]MDB6686355.1 DUF4012 domain-containing protein [Bifidobacterium longum]MDB6688236.1 DUF4012 domain-containing protein [Bifidobacterium longum]MDB6690222.1 DUF4012 domain-containing protein [Bifidobacterium longum]MDB6692195.1 DUF4012 domain-containing protein [Bifidobacterium longum]